MAAKLCMIFLPCLCFLISIGLGWAQVIQPFPTVQTVENGDRISLDCVVRGTTSDADVEWKHDGRSEELELISLGDRLIRDHNGAYQLDRTGSGDEFTWSLTIRSFNGIRDSGIWICTHIRDNNEVSQRTELLVPAVPVITHFTGDLNPIEGSDVRLECVADGNPLPSVVWSRSYPEMYLELSGGVRKGFVRAMHNNTLMLNQISRTQRGEYTCVANSNAATSSSSSSSSSSTIQIRTMYLQMPYAPEVKATLPRVYVTEDHNAVLACTSQAYPATSSTSDVVWLKNGGDVRIKLGMLSSD
ncbi:protein amalgam-like [Diadema setosum]|uniref:protein amalgam-like n=1 Tax=Diadema setosum TaxID=31175 RepID=UPI003B3B6699